MNGYYSLSRYDLRSETYKVALASLAKVPYYNQEKESDT